MAQRVWQVSKVHYCERVRHEVALETEVVYPPEHLPDQPPRVIAHRCSNALECNQEDRMSCAWCGTHPNYFPL
ncbi:MAG TPA: hypothetical protein VNK49_09845 [Anaerolineales bacterium]|nr:hypothetical protein [Anaerolineales bacterium]